MFDKLFKSKKKKKEGRENFPASLLHPFTRAANSTVPGRTELATTSYIPGNTYDAAGRIEPPAECASVQTNPRSLDPRVSTVEELSPNSKPQSPTIAPCNVATSRSLTESGTTTFTTIAAIEESSTVGEPKPHSNAETRCNSVPHPQSKPLTIKVRRYCEAVMETVGMLTGVQSDEYGGEVNQRVELRSRDLQEDNRYIMQSIDLLMQEQGSTVPPTLKERLTVLHGRLSGISEKLCNMETGVIDVEATSHEFMRTLESFLLVNQIAGLVATPIMRDKQFPDPNEIAAIKATTEKFALSRSINSFPRAAAAFNDYSSKKRIKGCFEGTREALLGDMADWTTTLDTSIYVLYGLAGTGKSTVAYTVAERAHRGGYLGASFFFSRDEDDRNNAKKFFTTIAFQLCVYDQTFARAIETVASTEQGENATTKGPHEQLEILIISPLQRIMDVHSKTVVIVVDALDECDEEDATYVLAGLNKLVQDLPYFKVILTSRPRPTLPPGLNPLTEKVFHLQDIEHKIVDADIRLYLAHNLSGIQVSASLPRLRTPWAASDQEIDLLVGGAAGLFIVASTSIMFILDKIIRNPASQMEKLRIAFAQDHTPFKVLNNFYTIVIRSAVPAECENQTIEIFQKVIGTIVLIQDPLPIKALGHLVDVDEADTWAVIENLQSVILIGANDTPVVYHKSFPDFLMDPKRCDDVELRIVPDVHHTRLATRCLQVMNKHLTRNILNLSTPARFLDNNHGLEKEGISEDQLFNKIPPELRYACTYWVNHFSSADLEDTVLRNELEIFANQHLLHWFEALSWIRKLDLTHSALLRLTKLQRFNSPDLQELFSEGLRFVSRFYELIGRSALHTYYSALPFTPTGGVLYNQYKGQADSNLCEVHSGPSADWGALVAFLDHDEVDSDSGSESWDSEDSNWTTEEENDEYTGSNDAVDWVEEVDEEEGAEFDGEVDEEEADTEPKDTDDEEWDNPYVGGGVCRAQFSMDSTHLASWTRKGLRLWDANSGIPIKFIEGQRIILSEDFSTVALIQEKTVRLFAITSDNPVAVIEHEIHIVSLALSYDGSKLATGMLNGTVSLRDAMGTEEKPIAQCDGYPTKGGQLQFSPSGHRLAFVMDTGNIALWNALNGQHIATLRQGLLRHIELAFTRDGLEFASLAEQDGARCLILRNAEKGEIVGVAEDVGNRLTISADGTIIATSDDEKAQLWTRVGNGGDALTMVEEYHLPGGAVSVAFTSDKIAVHYDNRVQVHERGNFNFLAKLPITDPSCLAFSADVSRLAVGNRSGNLGLWDVPSIRSSNDWGNVSALSFSFDGSKIASGFTDGHIELWDLDREVLECQAMTSDWIGINTLHFSEDGEDLASASDDGILRLWNRRNLDGKPTLFLAYTVPEFDVTSVTFSNNLLAASTSECIALWNRHSHERVDTISTPSCDCSLLSLAPDSSVLVSEYQGCVTVWQLDEGEYRSTGTFNIESEVETLTLSPDGLRLAVATRGSLKLFDIPTKSIIVDMGHEDLGWVPKPSRALIAPDKRSILGAFPDCDDIPILWLPKDCEVYSSAVKSSVIALGLMDGRILFIYETLPSPI